MLKKTLLILVLLALLLAACSPATQVPTPIPTRSSAQPTAKPAATKAGQTGTETGNLENCTAASSVFPTPNATEAAQNSLFPPVSDEDWSLGVKEAEYTFIEYSDFQ